MNIGVIQFPGSNCERETIRSISRAGMTPVPFLWNEPTDQLSRCDGYVIVGGFSYEDRSRAGVIAAHDPLMKTIIVHAERGKPVLGICNGAQILVESGLVPGCKNYALGAALSQNKQSDGDTIVRQGFYNEWVHLRMTAPTASSVFTRHLEHRSVMRVPVAHAEGRFIIPKELLQEIKDMNQIVFQYSDQHGHIVDQFPINPNGSLMSIAALGNPAGNVLAIMPHPERSDDGLPLFTSMRDYIQSSHRTAHTFLQTNPPRKKVSTYIPPMSASELITELIITDNAAKSVEQAVRQGHPSVSVSRFDHWMIGGDTNAQDVGSQLYNENKERPVNLEKTANEHTAYLLVQDKDDLRGMRARQSIERSGKARVGQVRYGTLWKLSFAESATDKKIEEIINTHIFHNPYSQHCMRYHAPAPKKDATARITAALNTCLEKTDLPLGRRLQGKVRDRYEQEDKLILITTDRQSAFDRVLAAIPFKGQVLNLTSAWWFEKTKHIIPNHVLSIPDPNVTVAKKVDVFPVEFVVRGYITGTTGTSAWVNYRKGIRDFCGNTLPEGMKKNQEFASPIITPTTKSDDHDRLISPKEIVDEELMSKQDWDYCSQKARALFSFGQAIAREHGLILVDTKYEMGRDKDGNIMLVDELHTPDSSRYWIAQNYEQRVAEGKEPDNIDKEFLRLWFTKHCDPYNDETLPPAPPELVTELSKRYIQLFEMITGRSFAFPPADVSAHDRLKKTLRSYAQTQPVISDVREQVHVPQAQENMLPTVVLILGSHKDEQHAKKITDALSTYNIPFEQHVASAHKQAKKGIALIEQYAKRPAIFVTIAGRSNALSGFMAGNSNKPVIACPPFKDKLDMLVNIHSTLQMPSHVPVMTILDPENVAHAIFRMCHMSNGDTQKQLAPYMEKEKSHTQT
jgi:phosphoribosylaminoimidazole-succinocarboxamide synthase